METEILKELIKESGLSQKAFSEKIGYPEPRISEWLKGARNPKMSTLKEIAKIFGLSIETKFIIKKNKI